MKKIMFNDKYGLTQAVLDGRKTMTRRIVTYPSKFRGQNAAGCYIYDIVLGCEVNVVMYDKDEPSIDSCYIYPKYQVGEVVAIAQSYKDLGYSPDSLDRDPKDLGIRGFMQHHAGWNNKMFVRATACKHHIRITNIKVERLQNISNDDCLNEGIIRTMYKSADGECRKYYWHLGVTKSNCPYGQYKEYDTPLEAFSALIDGVSGKGTWESNPYVFVYEFELTD